MTGAPFSHSVEPRILSVGQGRGQATSTKFEDRRSGRGRAQAARFSVAPSTSDDFGFMIGCDTGRMNTLVLYFSGGAFLIISALLSRHTSTYSHAGGVQYDRKRTRRLAAIALLVAALIFFALG